MAPRAHPINIHRPLARAPEIVLREFRARWDTIIYHSVWPVVARAKNSGYRLRDMIEMSCYRCEATVRSSHDVNEPFVDTRDTEVFGKYAWLRYKSIQMADESGSGGRDNENRSNRETGDAPESMHSPPPLILIIFSQTNQTRSQKLQSAWLCYIIFAF